MACALMVADIHQYLQFGSTALSVTAIQTFCKAYSVCVWTELEALVVAKSQQW